MPAKYFFGRSVKSSSLSPSSARTFAEVVKKHIETAFKLGVTREAYQALQTRAEKLSAKDSPYLVACTFASDEASRSAEHLAGPCNLIFLDIDEATDARSLTSRPENMVRSLNEYNFAAYTTASSTPEKPRLRVVVDADGISPDQYEQAVHFIASKLSLKAVTSESLIPKQPMILPSIFCDDDPDTQHPLVVSHLAGRALTAKDILTFDTKVEVSKSTKGGVIPAVGFHGDGEDDGLQYLRMPLPGFTLEMAREALNHMDADKDYFQWMDVAAALKHQWGHSDPNAAFDLFDRWSSEGKGGKYVDEQETLHKWDSLKPSPKGRLPITIRTLIKRASEAGWNAAPAKEACFKSVQDWITLEAKSLHDFSTLALEKVAALPNPSASEEAMLLGAIATLLKERHGEKVTKTDLAKDLKKLRDRRARAKDENREKIPPWSVGWCYVTKDCMFFRPTTGQRINAEALNSAYSRELLPSKDWLEAQGKDATPEEMSKPTMFPSDFLLNHQRCLVCDGYLYDPSSPNDVYSDDPHGFRSVNIYQKPTTKPTPDTAESAGAVWLGHLAKLIKEPEYRRVITDYIAYMVQFPGRKVRWAILIQGAEGCGKSYLTKILSAVLGEPNVRMINNDILRSTWTDWATGSQVVILSEIRVAGQNRHDIMNRLKEAITDDRIPINQKGKDSRTVINVTNYIGFTNFPDALAVGEGSRRWFVIKSPLQTPEQVKALGDDYFDILFQDLAANPGGYRAFFENWEISSDFAPDGRAPDTIYLKEMIEDSADAISASIRELIRENENPLIQDDLISQTILKELLDTKESTQYVTRILRENQYNAVPGRAEINGIKHRLWIKSGTFEGLQPSQIYEIARARHNPSEEDNWI